MKTTSYRQPLEASVYSLTASTMGRVKKQVTFAEDKEVEIVTKVVPLKEIEVEEDSQEAEEPPIEQQQAQKCGEILNTQQIFAMIDSPEEEEVVQIVPEVVIAEPPLQQILQSHWWTCFTEMMWTEDFMRMLPVFLLKLKSLYLLEKNLPNLQMTHQLWNLTKIVLTSLQSKDESLKTLLHSDYINSLSEVESFTKFMEVYPMMPDGFGNMFMTAVNESTVGNCSFVPNIINTGTSSMIAHGPAQHAVVQEFVPSKPMGEEVLATSVVPKKRKRKVKKQCILETGGEKEKIHAIKQSVKKPKIIREEVIGQVVSVQQTERGPVICTNYNPVDHQLPMPLKKTMTHMLKNPQKVNLMEEEQPEDYVDQEEEVEESYQNREKKYTGLNATIEDLIHRSDFTSNTSGILQSISTMVDGESHSLKSMARIGKTLVKLDVYPFSEVQNLPKNEWWKKALWRSTSVILSENSLIVKQIEELQKMILVAVQAGEEYEHTAKAGYQKSKYS